MERHSFDRKDYTGSVNGNNRLSTVSFHAVVLLGIFVFAVGYAGARNLGGTLVLDTELYYTFASYQILPDHKYYITGSYSIPAAILAIHKDYQLDNEANLWVPVPDVNSDHMELWVSNLDKYTGINFWGGSEFLAGYILGPDKKSIGAWYSSQRYTIVDFIEDNRIKVYTPDLNPIIGGESERGIFLGRKQ
jgi:hypothetical protein